MEENLFYKEAIDRINNKRVDATIALADSILALVNDTIANANERKGNINSIKKYKNLGTISKKENSLIEKSSYEMGDDGLIIKLNYSKLLPKYKGEENLFDNGSKFNDDNIDYEVLNNILSKYNIEVAKEESEITAPKYCNIYKKVLTISLKKKEEIKKDNKDNIDLEEYAKKIKHLVSKTIILLMILLDFDKDLFTKLCSDFDNEKDNDNVVDSIEKIKKYIKSISSFLTNMCETEEEKFERVFGQTKEDYVKSKSSSKTTDTVEKVKKVVTENFEKLDDDSSKKLKEVFDKASKIYEKVKEGTKPIIDDAKQAPKENSQDDGNVKNILLNFFQEVTPNGSSTLNDILSRIPKK